MLTTTQLQAVKDPKLEQRQILVLRAWEAVSTERELQGVLEAITQVLSPIVPMTASRSFLSTARITIAMPRILSVSRAVKEKRCKNTLAAPNSFVRSRRRFAH